MNEAGHSSRAVYRCRGNSLWWLRPSYILLTAIMISTGGAAQTSPDEEIENQPLRFDLTPLIGYRTVMSFPTGPPGQESGPNVILDAKPSYGVAFGVRVDEENLVELRWARQDTHIYLEGSAPSANERVTLNQFHADFTHEYTLEDSNRWRSWAHPFVMGSVGATRLSGGAGNSFTRFSFGLGGGVKVYFSRHLGLRIQAEWLPLVVNPEVGSFVCGGGCIVQLSSTLVSQGEIVAGPVFRF